MTSLYTAIMQAADHIERNPKEFNWWSTVCPEHPGCGTPGCALGWIGTFAGMSADGMGLRETATLLIGSEEPMEFYCRMDESCEEGVNGWTDNPRICAKTLRRYAERFHQREQLQLRTDAELVADLMARVSGEQIPEDAHV